MNKKVGSDIEIARDAKMKPIREVANSLGIPDEHLLPYGHTKAKISMKFVD
jgi:formate--tetrahydrofolate ligase